MRTRLAVGAVVLGILGAALAVFLLRAPGDVVNEDVGFTAEPPPTVLAPPAEPEPEQRRGRGRGEPRFTWGHFGYSKDRRRVFPAGRRLRPPFERKWAVTGRILLEFPPVIGGRQLFLLKNNAALYGISKRTGKVRWKRKLGHLAAASPAYAPGTVFVTVLQRGKSKRSDGRVVALSASTGRTKWSVPLPSRTESSPLVHRGRLYFGSEDGTVYALRSKTGEVRWRYRAAGAVKSALALADGKLYFGDYGGRVHAIRASDGRRVWSTGTRGARFGLSSGAFYSTPAVAYGRVYLGNTDGRVYSLSSSNGRLAWTRATGGYVYASPAVGQVPGGGPTVWIGSYSGRFYALDARTGRPRWIHQGQGRISGSPTVIGDIVYYANLAKKATIGLNARTGRREWLYGRGSFTPVVSDGRRLYVTGYSSLYAFAPR